MTEPRSCVRCDQDISPRRLEVLPDTTLCRDCSQEVGGEFKMIVTPENTGKAGSIKKNYGSWSFKRIRRDIPRLEE